MANETTKLTPGLYEIPNDCKAFVRAGHVYDNEEYRDTVNDLCSE